MIAAGLVLALVLSAAGPIQAQDSGDKDAEPTTLDKHARWVTSVALVGDTLITAGGQSLQYRPGEIHLWSLSDGKHQAALGGHTSNVWSIAVSSDGKSLVSTGYDGKVIVFDLEKKEPRATLEKSGWTRAAAFSPDGQHFATGHEDGSVVLWETAAAKEVKTIKAHEAAIFDLAFSPDGKTLATASTDHTAKLYAWQEAEPKELAKLEHDDAVWSVAFAPKEPLLATAGADRKIKLWHPSGKEVAVLEGHRDWVSDLAFSPDGKWLASSDQGRTVRLWDVAQKSAVADLKGYTSSVWCVHFTPDNNQLISGSHDDALVIWDLPQKKARFRDWQFAEPAPLPEPPKAEEPAADPEAEKKEAEKKEAEKKEAEKKEAEKKEAEKKEPEKKEPEKQEPEKQEPEKQEPEKKEPEKKEPEKKEPEKKEAEKQEAAS